MNPETICYRYGGYWGEHPIYTVELWRYEVNNEDTRLGYWEWVVNEIRNEENEE